MTVEGGAGGAALFVSSVAASSFAFDFFDRKRSFYPAVPK
jgi:hypothetical protein